VKRAKLTAEHFHGTQGTAVAVKVELVERRLPANARLRELMHWKREIDFQLHAERLKLGR
jgi:hypothetical protein